MAFKSLKSVMTSLATPFLNDIVSNFANTGSSKDAGKVAAKLLSKSPFELPDSPDQKVRQNPLSFSPVQYPLDLGSNELGHYIVFESGFVSYKAAATESAFIQSGEIGRSAKITAKTPSHSITTSAIALYMPTNVKATYSQDYESDTAGMAGDLEGIANRVMSAEGAKNKVEAGLKGVISPAIRKGKEALGEFISLAGAGDPVRFAAKRAGVAINPRNEQFYNSPNFRSFSFDFDFWPRNEKEAEAVDKIIAIFKYNSSPGFLGGTLGGVFQIPNYFRISYMFNNGENPHLNKIGACYCTGVEVDYAPDGQFTTFKDGRPVHTKLTVSFIEDRIITKQDIEQGA